jgi:hypothetical protein
MDEMKLQNYLDQYVVDKMALRILHAKYNTEFFKVFSNLRRHESPHIIIMEKTRNSEKHQYIELDGYIEVPVTSKIIRVWHRLQFNTWHNNTISYQKTNSKDHIYIHLTSECNNELIIDSKRRYFCTLYNCTYWINATGKSIYYIEHRIISQNCVITRVLTHIAKKEIISGKLPFYVAQKKTTKGQFLHNLTNNIISFNSTDLLQNLKHFKTLASKEILENIMGQEQIYELLKAKFIEYSKESGFYHITKRGHYLLYYSSSSSIYSSSDDTS